MMVVRSPSEETEVVVAGSRALLGMIARTLGPALEQVDLLQYRLLVLLTSRGQLTRTEVVAALASSPLSVDAILRRLASLNLVMVSGPDAVITSRGRALVDEVTERRRVEIARLLGRLDEAQRRTVTDALALIADTMGEPQPEELLILGL